MPDRLPSVPHRKVTLPETIHSLLGTFFSHPFLPTKAFHFAQLHEATFCLLDGTLLDSGIIE